MMALSPTTDDMKAMPIPKLWLQQSVRQCFETYNWEGRAQLETRTTLDSNGASPSLPELSFKLPVKQFFGQFPWEGTPEIAVPVAPLGVPAQTEADNDLTLDVFSDLF